MPARVAVIPGSHLDLFWLGDYRNCLRRGDDLIRQYLARCRDTADETFVIDTVIFAQHFVENNPDWVPLVRQLLAEHRLEIGSAYIDHRENLVLGEAMIRNIQIGRGWLRDTLGIDAKLAAHPDLPGLHAQTPQMYAKAGIQYYVTSRKVFQNGRIWRDRAPDGSAILVLTWPMHYILVPMTHDDIPEHEAENWVAGRVLDRTNLEERYPFGTVAVAGSAGDLTDPVDFVRRYGRDLRDYIAMYRDQYPDTVWEYSIPAQVMAPYLEHPEVPIAERSGSIPSVWGTGAMEASMLHAIRDNEAGLLAAEAAAVLATVTGRPALPAGASTWEGLFSEDAFFARRDPAPDRRELEWLWRMHIFTQDHNSGGQDGTLSAFQKKVRQDRVRDASRQVIDYALGVGHGTACSVFRSRLGDSETHIILDGDSPEAAAVSADAAASQATQIVVGPDGRPRLAATLAPGRGVGVAPLELAATAGAGARVTVDTDVVGIGTPTLDVVVDRRTGEATVTERATGQVWRGIDGALWSVPELKTSATLCADETAQQTSGAAEVSIVASGPLCTQVRVARLFLGVPWAAVLTVWHDIPRVDLDQVVQWPGLVDLQLRLGIVAAVPRSAIHYGTAFHGSRWDEVPEDSIAGWANDELTPEAWASYREVQHWLHVTGAQSNVTITTSHIGFYHNGEDLAAVLFRTPASGGDLRFHFTNAGTTDWHFEYTFGADDWLSACERGDRAWRKPVLRANATDQTVDVLRAVDGEAILSALYPEPDGTVVVRLVNESPRTAGLTLGGPVVRGPAEIIDLAGAVLQPLSVAGDTVQTTLGPWEIQTIRFAAVPTHQWRAAK